MMKIIAVCIFALASISSSYSNVASTRKCGGRVFVDEAILIDASTQQDCIWEFLTKEDRILVFTVVGGNVKDAQQFLTIHDGVDIDSPILLVDNQKILERTRQDLPQAVYTTQPAASVRFKTAPTSNFQLQIQKAVNCPFDLGSNTACGRLIDEISCYCVNYNLRNHNDQTTSCLLNGFKLLALESRTEETVLANAWGNATRYWTSLTDNLNEGVWLWGSTGTGIVGGYSNWAIGQPDGSGNCVHLNDASPQGGWNDDNCANLREAICEGQP